MSRLANFFDGTETKFGIFYPQNYLVAVYPDYPSTEAAEKKVRASGVPQEEVIAVPGQDVVDWTEEHLVKKGLWGLLMTQLSEMFATEETYNHADLEHAKQGAGFLAVHCPTAALKESVWKTIEFPRPLVARHYSFGGVEHLYGENRP